MTRDLPAPSVPRAPPPPPASAAPSGGGRGPAGTPVPPRPPGPPWFVKAGALASLLLAAGLLIAAGRGFLLWRAGLRAGAEALHGVPVADLGGGFVVTMGDAAHLDRPGFDRDLQDGEEIVVGGHRFRYDAGGAGAGWDVVLKRPFRVYAATETASGPRGGWNRIDLGGDPLGGLSRTRDQVYIDPETVAASLPEADRPAFRRELGFARLLPREGEVFRLADRAVRVQAEVAGLSVFHAGERHALPIGKPAPLMSGDVLEGHGHRVRLTIEAAVRSEPVVDARGAITGYRPVREPMLVVAIPAAAETRDEVSRRAALVTWLPVEGEPVAFPLAADRPNRFYGADDRVGPKGGRVVPRDLPDRELLDLFARGLAEGAVRVDRGFVRVLDRHAVLAARGDLGEAGEAYLAAHPDGALYRAMDPEVLDRHVAYLEAVARDAGNRVQELALAYDRALDPGWVALPGDPADFALLASDGPPRPAVPQRGGPSLDGALALAPPEPWEPFAVPPGEARSFTLRGEIELPRDADGRAVLRLGSPLPLEVAVDDGPPVFVPAPDPGAPPGVRDLVLPGVEPGRHALAVTATYTGRPADFGRRAPIEARALPVEGSDGGPPHAPDPQAAEGPSAPVAAAYAPVAARIGELPFDRWCDADPRADVEAAGLWRDGTQPGDGVAVSYLRLHFDLPPGPVRLEVRTDGQVLGGCWDGVPIDPPRLGSPRAATGGPHVLALKVAHRELASPDGAGGVRFHWRDGKPTGLSPEVVTRSARPAVLPAGDLPALVDRDGRSVPRLVVERGVPGLPDGTEIPIGEALDGPGRVVLLLPDEGAKGELLARGPVKVRLKPGSTPPLDVLNGGKGRLELFRQLDPVSKPFQPIYGFAVYAGRPEPFRDDRDTFRDGAAWVTLREGPAAFARGEVILVHGGALRRLVTTRGWDLPRAESMPAGEWVVIERDAAGAVSVPAAASPAGPVERWHAVTRAEGPGPLAAGARILLPGSGLLLRHARDGGTLRPEERPSLGLEPLLRAGPLDIEAGEAATLTLDADLQAAAQAELQWQVAFVERLIGLDKLARAPGQAGLRGAFVALDAGTGEVLAAATVADPVADPAVSPWGLSWAPPGSTFKMVTSLAALASGDRDVLAMTRGATPSGLARVGATGSLAGATLQRAAAADGRPAARDPDGADLRLRTKLKSHKRGKLPDPPTLEEAMEISSNTWFGYLSLMMHRPLREGWIHAPVATPGLMDRLYPLQAMARSLGFGEVVDLFSGAGRRVARRWPVLDASGRPLSAGDSGFGFTGRFPYEAMEDPQIAATGIGQGEVTTTPLQMARVAAAVATGNRVSPRLLARIGKREIPGMAPVSLAPGEAERARVRAGMRKVVDEGSAKLAFADNPYRRHVFGKTGTAERSGPGGEHVTDSWFAGFVEPPAGGGAPVAFACLVPGAGLGGTHAAEVVERWVTFLVRNRGWDAGYEDLSVHFSAAPSAPPDTLPGD